MFKKILIFILLVVVGLGCSKSYTVIKPEDVNNIKIELKDFDESDQQYVYSLVLKNNSPHVIKQNSVSMGYQVNNGCR